jgi:4-hydroxybenzoate polyprenyltransferase
METTNSSTHKTIEYTIWIIGMLGILFVIMNQNTIGGASFITKEYFPFILIASMVLISLSLILKIRREKKAKPFSVYNHLYEIIRTAGGLGFAIYALIQNW